MAKTIKKTEYDPDTGEYSEVEYKESKSTKLDDETLAAEAIKAALDDSGVFTDSDKLNKTIVTAIDNLKTYKIIK